MTIKHHPSDETLMRMAAGALGAVGNGKTIAAINNKIAGAINRQRTRMDLRLLSATGRIRRDSPCSTSCMGRSLIQDNSIGNAGRANRGAGCPKITELPAFVP